LKKILEGNEMRIIIKCEYEEENEILKLFHDFCRDEGIFDESKLDEFRWERLN